jgi:hypothetical protein
MHILLMEEHVCDVFCTMGRLTACKIIALFEVLSTLSEKFAEAALVQRVALFASIQDARL